jgi:hypothetical protein
MTTEKDDDKMLDEMLAGFSLFDDEAGPEIIDEDEAAEINEMNALATGRMPSTPVMNELLPTSMDGLDLSMYDLVPVAQRGEVENFVAPFLTATRAEFLAKGAGTYECVLRFPYKRPVDQGDVEDYERRVRVMISRLRKLEPSAPPFYVVMMNYEILPDLKHVAFSMARMSPPVYRAYMRDHRKTQMEVKSVLSDLRSLMK